MVVVLTAGLLGQEPKERGSFTLFLSLSLSWVQGRANKRRAINWRKREMVIFGGVPWRLGSRALPAGACLFFFSLSLFAFACCIFFLLFLIWLPCLRLCGLKYLLCDGHSRRVPEGDPEVAAE